MSKPIHLDCAVCAQYAGKWHQHFNRDTGHGLCAKCRDDLSKTETPEHMRMRYGVAGVNYEAAKSNEVPT